MFYIALLVLVLLGLIALVTVGFNLQGLQTGIHLNLFLWHPGVPVLLLCILSAFLGGLLLYVVSTFSARGDAREIKRLRKRMKELRERVEELEQSQAKTGSATPAAGNFVQPVVPLPGLVPSGPLPQGSFPPNPIPQRPTTGPLPPRPSTSSLANLSPGSSGIASTPVAPRQGPPPPLPQTGGPRPPFFQQ